MQKRYRRGASFIRDVRPHSTPLDRNQRARILFLAQKLDRSTKLKGGRNGVLGYIGLEVLRALLLVFHNQKTGACFPSYDRIQEVTRLSRQSIARGLARLEAAGIIKVTRRRQRAIASVGGLTRQICVQASNVYAFAEPDKNAHLLPVSRPSVAGMAAQTAKLLKMVCKALSSSESTGGTGTRERDSLRPLQLRFSV